MTVILTAAETVTSPSMWAQVAAIAAALGAIAAAGTAFIKFVPGVRKIWDTYQARRKLERVEAWKAIAKETLPEVIEPQFADLRAQIVETQDRVAISERKVRAELVAHTSQERQLVRAVIETVARVRALRQSDVDQIRRSLDLDDETWEHARGEIPPDA